MSWYVLKSNSVFFWKWEHFQVTPISEWFLFHILYITLTPTCLHRTISCNTFVNTLCWQCRKTLPFHRSACMPGLGRSRLVEHKEVNTARNPIAIPWRKREAQSSSQDRAKIKCKGVDWAWVFAHVFVRGRWGWMTVNWAARQLSSSAIFAWGTLTGLCPDVWEEDRAEQSYPVFVSFFPHLQTRFILVNKICRLSMHLALVTWLQIVCGLKEKRKIKNRRKCWIFYPSLIVQEGDYSDEMKQFKQLHMSVRSTVTRLYHNQASLNQMCCQCGGSMCFKSLFFPVWLCASIHTLVKQNIQIETPVRLGGHSLINSEP